ncbi:MAG: hypothetical protein ACYDBV_07390 [Nitrospiria bacterium]
MLPQLFDSSQEKVDGNIRAVANKQKEKPGVPLDKIDTIRRDSFLVFHGVLFNFGGYQGKPVTRTGIRDNQQAKMRSVIVKKLNVSLQDPAPDFLRSSSMRNAQARSDLDHNFVASITFFPNPESVRPSLANISQYVENLEGFL